MTQLILPGDAGFGDVLSGKKFSAGTNYNATGTMPNNGAVTLIPSGTGSIPIPQGYHDGGGKVTQVSVPTADVLSGTTIAGVAGTMPNNGSPIITPGTSNQALSAGHYGGVTVEGDANLVAANIVNGVSIFNVIGTTTKAQAAKGSGTTSGDSTTLTFYSKSGSNNAFPYITVTGLTFLPSIIYWTPSGNVQLFSSFNPLANGDTINLYSSGTYYVDGTSAYVTSTGFRLPVYSAAPSGSSFSWEAHA